MVDGVPDIFCWTYFDCRERIPYQRCHVRLEGPYEGEIDNIAVRAKIEEDVEPICPIIDVDAPFECRRRAPEGWQYEVTSIEISHSCFKCDSCRLDEEVEEILVPVGEERQIRSGCWVEFDISRDSDAGPNTIVFLTSVFHDYGAELPVRLEEPITRVDVCVDCLEVFRYEDRENEVPSRCLGERGPLRRGVRRY